jgi:hypothetical protein
MGAGCANCNQEKSSDELSISGLFVPETIKINVFPATGSVAESDYESVQFLSLPSLSNEGSGKSNSFIHRISKEMNRIMNSEL